MQVCKWPLWVTVLALAAFSAHVRGHAVISSSLAERIGQLALAANLLAPLAIGVLMADRLTRDDTLDVSEMLAATPASRMARLWGKYLGVTLASLAPLATFWMATVVYVAVSSRDLTALPLGLLAFAVILVPGTLFVGVFSLTVPRVTGVPLYRVLFIGYWFWGNLVPPRFVPTLASTWLSPAGQYAKVGFFGGQGVVGLAAHRPGPAAALASVAVLVAASIAALVTLAPSASRTIPRVTVPVERIN